jgi:pilus assembly protein Flp/PilA
VWGTRTLGRYHFNEIRKHSVLSSALSWLDPGIEAIMKTFTRLAVRFVRDETGATAIEYGLIAAGIAVAIITVTKGLGSKLNTTFTSIQSALK